MRVTIGSREAQLVLTSRGQLFRVFGSEDISLQFCKVHDLRAWPSHPSGGMYLVGDECSPDRGSKWDW